MLHEVLNFFYSQLTCPSRRRTIISLRRRLAQDGAVLTNSLRLEKASLNRWADGLADRASVYTLMLSVIRSLIRPS